jgi:hypothetical protein
MHPFPYEGLPIEYDDDPGITVENRNLENSNVAETRAERDARYRINITLFIFAFLKLFFLILKEVLRRPDFHNRTC